jgi:hypothetical protein
MGVALIENIYIYKDTHVENLYTPANRFLPTHHG